MTHMSHKLYVASIPMTDMSLPEQQNVDISFVFFFGRSKIEVTVVLDDNTFCDIN